jgi:hypothetical protein
LPVGERCSLDLFPFAAIATLGAQDDGRTDGDFSDGCTNQQLDLRRRDRHVHEPRLILARRCAENREWQQRLQDSHRGVYGR